MRAPVLMLLLAPMALGCGPDLLGPEFAHRFTHLSGCADVVFFGVDADDEVLVTFQADGLVAAARDAGVETATVVDFPSDEVELIVEQGSHISDAICDDVIENSGPRVQRTWTAAAGRATVRIRPREDSSGGYGDLDLEDVVFTSPGVDDVTLESLEWTNVSVGWFPG